MYGDKVDDVWGCDGYLHHRDSKSVSIKMAINGTFNNDHCIAFTLSPNFWSCVIHKLDWEPLLLLPAVDGNQDRKFTATSKRLYTHLKAAMENTFLTWHLHENNSTPDV